jgi:hypothetical protein
MTVHYPLDSYKTAYFVPIKLPYDLIHQKPKKTSHAKIRKLKSEDSEIASS